MTINTGIDSSLLRPQTFHTISYLTGNRQLAPLPQRLVLIGPMGTTLSPAPTAVAGVVIGLDDPGQVDALFGLGSFMALMARKAFETAAMLGAGPRLFACPLAETTTKQVETATIVGTSTVSGDLIVRIAGRYITVGLASGSTETVAAAALVAAVKNKYQSLPVTAGAAAGVATFTSTVKGTLGNDVTFETVQIPAGLTLAWAVSVAGAGALDIQTALDAIAGQDFDGIAISNHVSGDITEINAHIASTWTAAEKRPRWVFVGEPGTIGTATSLASSANHEGVLVISMEQSRSLPGEIATASAVLALSKTRPNANYDGARLPLYPPPVSYIYTSGEVETALGAGLTPLTAIVDPASRNVVEGVVSVIRLITTRTTLASVPFTLLRDFGISRTTWAMARQYDLRFVAQFGSLANPDGVLLDDDTQKQIRDMVVSLNYAAQDAKWLRNVDNDKALIQVEPDASVSGRLNVDSSYTIVVGLHQVAFVHRAYQ
jgi:phage tail sheath gpL-like